MRAWGSLTVLGVILMFAVLYRMGGMDAILWAIDWGLIRVVPVGFLYLMWRGVRALERRHSPQ